MLLQSINWEALELQLSLESGNECTINVFDGKAHIEVSKVFILI